MVALTLALLALVVGAEPVLAAARRRRLRYTYGPRHMFGALPTEPTP